jgi:hypothetical protein
MVQEDTATLIKRILLQAMLEVELQAGLAIPILEFQTIVHPSIRLL